MNRIPILCIVLLCVLPGLCAADIAVLKNGDKHVGTVSNTEFSVMAPYGKIIARRDFIAEIRGSDDAAGLFKFHTINNDVFSGDLADTMVDFKKETGGRISVRKEEIRQLVFETYARPTYKTDTTVFFMKNGDKFSGTLLNETLALTTDSGEAGIGQRDISKVDFFETGPYDALFLLNNGSLLKGKILTKRFRIAPDSAAQITVCTERFLKIQFNVEKLIARRVESGEESKDTDGDGVRDDLDQCPDTPCSVRVAVNGCPPPDTDGDGVNDPSDKCPGTPKTAPVDKEGCWRIKALLFDTDLYEIKPEHTRILDSLAGVMKADPSFKIEIHGHTDNVADESYNMALSRKRAESARTYLTEKGIRKERIEIFWHGLSVPKASNETEEGRALNRRVELMRIANGT